MGVSLQFLVVGLYLLEHGINAGRLCAHPRKSEDGGAEYRSNRSKAGKKITPVNSKYSQEFLFGTVLAPLD